jgi:anti-sigma regulatory factor (Ser/Thr protein kinase)
LLLQASEALTKPVKLGDVLRELAEVVLGSTSHARSFVFLWDESRRVLEQAASAGREAFPPGRTFSFDSLSAATQRSIMDKRTVTVDFDALPEPQRGHALASQRSHVMLSVPVEWQDRLLAMIGVDDPGERREFTDREISIVEGIAAQAAISIENARLFGELTESLHATREKDRAIRQAYSDVIDAVTGGRLIILGRDEMAKVVYSTESENLEIREPSQLAEARERLRATLPGFPELDDLVLAFSEAATNMLKHAGGGAYRVALDARRVQIVLSDHGPGIDFRDLPKATLAPGFSTQQTLGVGFSIMMELTDRLLLSSGSDGTTLVLEKDRRPAERHAAVGGD